MNCVELRNVCYSAGKKNILKNITFEIPNNGMYAIIGPNGAGKSTLLKIITSVIKPSKGEVFINGKRSESMSRLDIAKNISVVPDSFETAFDFTVFDIVLMSRYAHNQKIYITKDDMETAHQALEKTNTSILKDSLYKTLSSGEKQAVLLARSIAQDCPVILLDEPTSNLDIKNQIEIMNILKNLNEKENKCIISIMHDINLAARYIDNFIILKKGQIVHTGNKKSVFRQEILSALYDINVDIFKDINTDFLFMQAKK